MPPFDPLAAGDLRHAVTFRSPVTVSDGQGGQVVTYPNADIQTACSAQSVSGVERLGPGAGLVTTEVQMLTVRRRTGISVKQRADVRYADTGDTVSYTVQRVERADDYGIALAIYCAAVES